LSFFISYILSVVLHFLKHPFITVTLFFILTVRLFLIWFNSGKLKKKLFFTAYLLLYLTINERYKGRICSLHLTHRCEKSSSSSSSHFRYSAGSVYFKDAVCRSLAVGLWMTPVHSVPGTTFDPCIEFDKLKTNCILFFIVYNFIDMCIHCLGCLSP
jgi:hypothetical protein